MPCLLHAACSPAPKCAHRSRHGTRSMRSGAHDHRYHGEEEMNAGRACAAAVALVSAFWSAAAVAQAKELSVAHSIRINAAPDAVWALAGDFGGIQRWSPGVESSRLVLRSRN